MSTDPNIFTKEQLKNELRTHGISLPPSDAKKSVYVELYRSEILDKTRSERLEFSSDDEIELTASKRKVSNQQNVQRLQHLA